MEIKLVEKNSLLLLNCEVKVSLKERRKEIIKIYKGSECTD